MPAWRVDKTFDYAVPAKLAEKVEVGALVRIRFGNRWVRGVVAGLAAGDGANLEDLAGVVTPAPIAPPPLDGLFEWISRRYVVPLGRAFARAVPPRVRVAVPEPTSPLPLEYGAVPAYDGGTALLTAIEDGRSGVWCFESLPGADRAALARDLVSAAMRAGSGAAVVCVPEVRYGSEVLAGLAEGFTDVARIDSNVAEAERSTGLMRLARGHRLGAGGRAAVLAPVSDLRLIVIDEEHHRSFKEDRAPRYDTRRVAIERARRQSAVCVLLSSTPTVESGAAARDGSFGSVRPLRADRRAARPLIEVTDIDPGRAISTLLHRRIREVSKDGGRVALLAPSRGYARAVWCAQCRRSLRCSRCEGGFHFDRTASPERRLRCPRCGRTESAPDACPNCGAVEFRWLGAGSQRLAEQLAKAFPRARVVHVDPDSIETAATRGSSADIYVTTWIGTKAAVRPDVSLVGIIDADALIRRPHFRAAEQAFQAFTHMAEWAGPAVAGGRLVVQSDEPSHFVIQALARGDYGYFLERELEERRELGYPPFRELVRIRSSGPAAASVTERVLSTCRAEGDRVLGPIHASTPEGDATEVLVKTVSAQAVAERLRVILPETPADTRLTIDVDPR